MSTTDLDALRALLLGLRRDDNPRREAIERAWEHLRSRCEHRGEVLTVGPHGRCTFCLKERPL